MPNLRNKVNKQKSDTFVLDNAKAQKMSTATVIKRVPVADQLKYLKEVYGMMPL